MKVLLFDIDGTLIHTGGAGRLSFVQALLSGFDVKANIDDVPFAGSTDPIIVRECFLRCGIELSTHNLNIFYENYLGCLQKNTLTATGHVKPGIREILETCQNGNGAKLSLKAGLLTGNIEAGAKVKLERFGLWKYFEVGAFSSDHEERDEIARIARARAMERWGGCLNPEDILVIGDTPRDIQCGKSIGARTVAVATGPHSIQELERCEPSLALSDLGRVEEFFQWVDGK